MKSSQSFYIRDFHTLDTSMLSFEELEETNATIPRTYQMEMFHRAMEGNVIAVLDTGSGKTLISCLIIKHIHNLDFECKRSRISVFVLLLYSQYSWFLKFLWFRNNRNILDSI